jgi:uncharacterized membrane protein YhaH (DUF805 family)
MQPQMQGMPMGARPANMMSIMDAVKTCLEQYVGFDGRASRSEYWWFFLAFGITVFVAGILDGIIFGVGSTDPTWISTILQLGLFLPSLAVVFRRLHDHGKSGWNVCWVFLILPIFYLIYLMIMDGEAQGNAYGPVPTNTL